MAEHGETQADEEEEEQVWSWGAGTDGQLGTTKLQDELLPQLLSLTSLPSISMLACGGAHVIALTSGGKVFTWGRGSSGQLGHGDILNITLPKLVSFFDDSVITQAAAGWSHSGFVSDSGCIFTCGNGSFGQLGHGDTLSLSTPAKVSHFNNDSVKMVACGMRHSLVLFAGNISYTTLVCEKSVFLHLNYLVFFRESSVWIWIWKTWTVRFLIRQNKISKSSLCCLWIKRC
jgi:alpha-tubulin suppressor-like RCC1 family protein